MTAYLVLDFTIHDLRGFMPYVAAIPAVMEGDWAPERHATTTSRLVLVEGCV
jgi:hypothetical protein